MLEASGVRVCEMCGGATASTRHRFCATCRRERERLRGREKQRRRRDADPSYVERQRKASRERNRARYAADPEYRRRQREYARERYAADPNHRERLRAKARARWKERYANDDSFRQKQLAKATEQARIKTAAKRAALRCAQCGTTVPWPRWKWCDACWASRELERSRAKIPTTYRRHLDRLASDPDYRERKRRYAAAFAAARYQADREARAAALSIDLADLAQQLKEDQP